MRLWSHLGYSNPQPRRDPSLSTYCRGFLLVGHASVVLGGTTFQWTTRNRSTVLLSLFTMAVSYEQGRSRLAAALPAAAPLTRILVAGRGGGARRSQQLGGAWQAGQHEGAAC